MKKLFLLAIIAIAAAVNANAQSFHGNGVSTYVDRSTMWERAKNHRAVINDKSRDIFIGDKNGRKAWFAGVGGKHFMGYYDECITMSEEKIMKKEKAPASSGNKSSVKNRDEIISTQLIFKMMKVGNKYAITRTPISYYLYWVVTGEKANGSTASSVANIPYAKQQKMVNTLNQEAKGTINFSIATAAQIAEAKRSGLQGGGTGFYLVMPYSQWKTFEGMY
jgi:hypothetical protein